MSNNTTIHKGSDHVFTNNSRESVINIRPGAGETLNISGTSSTSNELKLIADIIAVDTSDDLQTYTLTGIGTRCALGQDWFISNNDKSVDIYRKSGQYFVYSSNVEPSTASTIAGSDCVDIFDSSGTPLITTAVLTGLGSVVSMIEYDGSDWIEAAYAGDYDFTSATAIKSIAIFDDSTIFAIATNDKNIYKSVKTGGEWQKWTVSYNGSAFSGYPNEIKTNGIDRVVVSYPSEFTIRVFEGDGASLIQTYTDFFYDTGFAKSIDMCKDWLAIAANQKVVILDKIGNYVYGTTDTFYYFNNPPDTYYDLVQKVNLDRKDGRYVVINGSIDKEHFLVRKTDNSWIKQTMQDSNRIMTFPSSYATLYNVGAYGTFYLGGAPSINTVYIKPLILYNGTTTVAEISLDSTDYSVDFTSINEINLTVKDQTKLKVDYDSVDIKEKILFTQSANTQEVALQNRYIDEVALTMNSVDKLRITPSEVVAETPLRIQRGTVNNCGLSFENDNNTGIFQSSSDSLSITAGGINIADITMAAMNMNKPISMVQSSASFPTYSFAGDSNTGMYTDTADQVKFSTGGNNIFTLGTTGGVMNANMFLNSGNLTLRKNVNTTTGPFTFLQSGVYAFYGGVPPVTWQSIITFPNINGSHILLCFVSGINDLINCVCVCHIHVKADGNLQRTNLLLNGADNINLSGKDVQFRDYNGYGQYNCIFLASVPN